MTKSLKEYKSNEKVEVLILNPVTTRWEWVDGIVRGIVFTNTEFYVKTEYFVKVEFERITKTITSAKYDDNIVFLGYEISVIKEKVLEGIKSKNNIRPKKDELILTIDDKIKQLREITTELPYIEFYAHSGCEMWKINNEFTNYNQDKLVLCSVEEGFEKALDFAISYIDKIKQVHILIK